MSDISVSLNDVTDISVSLNDVTDISVSLDSDIGSNVISNGRFDSDTIWTKTAGWTISDGKAHSVAAELYIYQIGALELGETYEITFDITSYTSGTVRAMAGTGGGGTPRNAVGTYTEQLVCSGNTTFYIDGGFGANAFTGSVDNITAYKQ